MRTALLLTALVALASCYGPRYQPTKCTELNFLPMPNKLSCDIANNVERKFEDPCSILYSIQGDNSKQDFSHFIELIEHQQYKSFGCHVAHTVFVNQGKPLESFKLIGFDYVVTVEVGDPALASVFTTKEEAYHLTITKSDAHISAKKYVGFVRGLETFMQSITCDKYHVTNCSMIKLPI